MLVDDDENKEEEEDEMKGNNNTLKRMKVKGVKNNKKHVKTSKRQKHKSKVSEWLEHNGADYEEEMIKIKAMEIKLRKGNELSYKEHDKSKRKSVCVKKWHDTLVEELKEKISRDFFMNEEEECLEAEDIRKEVDRNFELEIRDKCFAESEEDSEWRKWRRIREWKKWWRIRTWNGRHVVQIVWWTIFIFMLL